MKEDNVVLLWVLTWDTFHNEGIVWKGGSVKACEKIELTGTDGWPH